MRELSVYYCQACGHYAYFQIPRNAVCHKCHLAMKLLDMRYQDFMDLSYEERDHMIAAKIIESSPTLVHRICTPSKLYNQREMISQLTTECSRLEKENEDLNHTVDWMHRIIWEQLRTNKALEQELALIKNA